ncbi:MAG: phosphotransferase [Clostridiaceae bacterium]|nr:phosphotransferase [Clostridiaceae bacterium]
MNKVETDVISTLKEVAEMYNIQGILIGYEKYINGHINDTYHVTFSSSVDNAAGASRTGNNAGREEYVFQRINDYVFKEPAKVMSNIKEITRYWNDFGNKTGNQPECDIISFIENKDGGNYTYCDGSYWRVCRYVDNSISYEFTEDPKVLYSAGYAFGHFQHVLSDFPMNRLYDTIPDFHNTKKRMGSFFETVKQDPLGRAKEVEEEIEFFRKYNKIASQLVEMHEEGKLPLRVTHNDTKYNNILMDKHTNEPLCVIDLDTVMPGLSVYDFGDAIRFAANTAVEDETDLSKVGLNMENYEAFMRGFISASREFLTKHELETMALGAIVITIELASRFLADHINGDKYFRVHRPNHNLDRARCQLQLAKDMIAKYDKMCDIVRNVYMEPRWLNLKDWNYKY